MRRVELTPAELTVLGLVIERPRHGYDLEQAIELRGVRQWTDIGFSSIYYLLAKLEKRGLVHVPQAPAAAKSRRVFHATDTGRRAARDGALDLIRQPRPVAHPLLVGVANLPLLSEREYAEALRDRLAGVCERIAAVREAERAQAPSALAAREVFSYSLSLLEAERSWLASRVQAPDDGQDRLQENP
ncbi:PadR family transcriptional regulator [Nocardiopsis dassonvillei]|uniref:Transcriptional regulator, PadR-like family n=1 Tax=Nocardiopsis dassonvillei (strain ATCC 23218 / DSM 43111 / CIP 107115 / JCM 7437 / KCTC 9190 / NBRC 14626 / NCTC 10488 / NRRL B-5397 / IMRU 509) TaxID=446468 RepID=D7B5E7_NOCDD|nr:helix-turn-helix transcriptional regulator [Nocardiopsis dassonvillei]ADH67214.1 transcriptional regulator, PadR-like family [Nocardiopsis dassonvillei subsp. dassonvillei DSM 43111]NKY78839.1 PadR family transcriptional regulator [Nocardiopsis dassonvillei]VEI87260.1 transcriptional regulator, Acidobacterial, PadR-family [Nocardiopsis dassonvillei]